MSLEAIAGWYDDIAPEYAELIKTEAKYAFPRVIPEILTKQKVAQRECDALDLACGAGTLKEYTSFRSYVGVDISAGLLAEAQGRGYDMLIHNDVANVLATLATDSVDCAIMLSAAYFMAPHELTEVIIQMQRVARKFSLFTLDGVTEKLAREYEENAGIKIYNHIGFPLQENAERFVGEGWFAEATGESVSVEYCFLGK